MTQYNNFDNVTKKDLNTLHKVIRLVNLNTKSQNNIKNSCSDFIPKRGNIVRCEFIGIGSEIDDTHYGIVWNAEPNSDTITIIPISSEFKEESINRFSIGCIPNFNTSKGTVKSYVYMNKMMEVSISRITPWLYKDSSGESQIVSITFEQVQRIKEGITILYADHSYLVGELKNLQLPINYSPDVLDYGYRAVSNFNIDKSNRYEWVVTFKTLTGLNMTIKMFYPRYNDSVKSLCKKIKYDDKHFKFRNNIIKGLFSGDEEKKEEAKSIIQELYSQYQSQQKN